jgi:hypothetical protein
MSPSPPEAANHDAVAVTEALALLASLLERAAGEHRLWAYAQQQLPFCCESAPNSPASHGGAIFLRGSLLKILGGSGQERKKSPGPAGSGLGVARNAINGGTIYTADRRAAKATGKQFQSPRLIPPRGRPNKRRAALIRLTTYRNTKSRQRRLSLPQWPRRMETNRVP